MLVSGWGWCVRNLSGFWCDTLAHIISTLSKTSENAVRICEAPVEHLRNFRPCPGIPEKIDIYKRVRMMYVTCTKLEFEELKLIPFQLTRYARLAAVPIILLRVFDF